MQMSSGIRDTIKEALWKQLTPHGVLQEQYDAIRSKHTSNEKGAAFALARFAEARIHEAAEQRIQQQAATIERLQRELEQAHQPQPSIPDEVRDTIKTALDLMIQRMSDNHYFKTIAYYDQETQRIDAALAWLEQAQQPQPSVPGKHLRVLLDYIDKAAEGEPVMEVQKIREWLEQTQQPADHWEPVEYEDVFTPQGEPIRPEYKRVSEKWENFYNTPSDIEDGYEYAICRRPKEEVENG